MGFVSREKVRASIMRICVANVLHVNGAKITPMFIWCLAEKGCYFFGTDIGVALE